MKFLTKIILLFTIFTFSMLANAKTINLLDAPKEGAKVVGSVDLSAGIIPIYKPSTGDWVKIADPKNGNVGWVKNQDLNTNNTTSFSFTQKIGDNGKEESYQVFQFGNPKMTDAQLKLSVEKMRAQQKAAQQAFSNMMKEINNINQQNWGFMKDFSFPMIMPIIVVPVDKNTQTKQPAKPPVTTTTKTPAQ